MSGCLTQRIQESPPDIEGSNTCLEILEYTIAENFEHTKKYFHQLPMIPRDDHRNLSLPISLRFIPQCIFFISYCKAGGGIYIFVFEKHFEISHSLLVLMTIKISIGVL